MTNQNMFKVNPDFSNQNGEAKLSGTIFSNNCTWHGERKLGVKLHCLIGEGLIIGDSKYNLDLYCTVHATSSNSKK